MQLDDLSLLLLNLTMGDLFVLLSVVLQVLKLEFQAFHFFGFKSQLVLLFLDLVSSNRKLLSHFEHCAVYLVILLEQNFLVLMELVHLEFGLCRSLFKLAL